MKEPPEAIKAIQSQIGQTAGGSAQQCSLPDDVPPVLVQPEALAADAGAAVAEFGGDEDDGPGGPGDAAGGDGGGKPACANGGAPIC